MSNNFRHCIKRVQFLPAICICEAFQSFLSRNEEENNIYEKMPLVAYELMGD